MEKKIEIFGARENNLKNIDLEFKKNNLVVITGVSGSGKSSLAFNTIYSEGQRRYMESFSAYARSFIGNIERPDVDKINGLSPVISIEQKTTSKNPRSTVGTLTEIYDFLRLLYARGSVAYSYLSGKKMIKQSQDQIVENIKKDFENSKPISDSLDTVRKAFHHSKPLGKPHAHQKYWQELLGQVGGRTRFPNLELTNDEKKKIQIAFEASGLIK